MTFNEPAVFAFLGHADGDPRAGAARLADGDPRRGQPAARACGGGRGHSLGRGDGAKVGIAFDVNQVAPATDTDRDRLAAAQWSSARDAWFLDPLFGRGYPELGLEAHGDAGHLEGVELERAAGRATSTTWA